MLRKIPLARGLGLRTFSSTSTTVDREEIKQFQTFVNDWWDENGPVKPLHSMNKLRIPLIRDGLINTGIIDLNKLDKPLPLEGLSILDVGCGGGILSEPLARLGGNVTGLDANPNIIERAKIHADSEGLKNITYVSSTIEDHASKNKEKYDAIVASEIVEHVTKKNEFIEACVKCLKPQGSLFITTMSKTFWANFAGIILSEHVFQLLPKGTHDIDKFIEPHHLQRILEDNSCRTDLIHGMRYNILTNRWHWSSNTSINYALQAVKCTET